MNILKIMVKKPSTPNCCDSLGFPLSNVPYLAVWIQAFICRHKPMQAIAVVAKLAVMRFYPRQANDNLLTILSIEYRVLKSYTPNQQGCSRCRTPSR